MTAVGCAHSVAGRDCLKGFVQRYCRLLTPNRRQKVLRWPTRGDLIVDAARKFHAELLSVPEGERVADRRQCEQARELERIAVTRSQTYPRPVATGSAAELAALIRSPCQLRSRQLRT